MTRPSRRHANIIINRARMGHNEDQLARALGVTREVMRGWAKKDKQFALALEEALKISRDYWVRVDEDVRRYDEFKRMSKVEKDVEVAVRRAQRTSRAFESARPS